MLISQLIGKRFKEKPGEALLASHSIMLRGGYIRQVSNGIYSLLPLGVRVVRKIEKIIRQEMNRTGGQEVLMPVVLPRELWDESQRYSQVGAELVRFKDRTDHDMVLAMTHEEAVVHLTRNDVNSYKMYPFMVYQIQTKFRDEPRSRGGLVRVREFTMKDAYSFHIDQTCLQKYYDRCAEAYMRIFERTGIPEVKMVDSDSGMMGGRIAHEFMLLAESGEDTIVKCSSCDYISNLEVAVTRRVKFEETEKPLELVYTPGKESIKEISKFLSIPEKRIAKVVMFEKDCDDVPVIAIIRGDLEVNTTKLSKVIKEVPLPAQIPTILSTGAIPGYASAINVTACRIIADQSVINTPNLVCGANQKDYHYLNFNIERDVERFEIADIASVREGEMCPRCDNRLEFKRGIEVGNIFQLGTKYTEKMNMRYLDDEGNEKTPIMGCYGIGIGRLMASIIEARHDDYGPKWPVSVAPFTVHMISLNLSQNQKEFFCDPIYEEFLKESIEVIYDNREERAGVQFADADLIGAPLRLIFSSKNFDNREIEWKRRDNGEKGNIKSCDVLEFVRSFLKEDRSCFYKD
jgi:prolyl-tRNA synthetase